MPSRKLFFIVYKIFNILINISLGKIINSQFELQGTDGQLHECQKLQKCISAQAQQKQLMQFSDTQIYLLTLMYEDLASRAKSNKLTPQNFNTFFHVNGLWGQEMFRRFDKSKQGSVSIQQFLDGMQQMVKSPLQKRVKILFEFYDVGKNNGIAYQELLKMLYSYPRQDLKRMITSDKFISSIDDVQLTYYFGPQRDSIDRYVMEQIPEQESQNQEPVRNPSVYQPSSTQFIKIQDNMRKILEEEGKKRKNNKSNNLNPRKFSAQESNKFKQKRSGGSMSFDFQRKPRKYQLTSNIASLVKKYAAYLFKQLGLDKNKDQLSSEQFHKLISQHDQIFASYFQGFHSYVWRTDQQGEAEYTKNTPYIESQGICCFKGIAKRCYLTYIRTTVFVFIKKGDRLPIRIINMQGLTVSAVKNEETGQYGIVFKHRDGLYQEKQYYFHSQKIQEEWIRLLGQFQSSAIYNQYQLLQRIGAGNFSVVYKGCSKQTKKEVAIKVIEKFKLSPNEMAVIKMECEILQLCHHPSIVRFIKKHDSKNHIYIVTQMLNQGDLFDYVNKNKFLEQFEAAAIMKQLIDAVKYLNELGLIHRDLKPENIMVCMNKEKNAIQRIKIIDFGFAVYKDNLKNLDKKQKFAGTPGFVAPEILKMEDYDESVDTFGLGVIMYFMLSGILPFNSQFYQDIIQQTLDCQVTYKNHHWMNVSEDAKDLLQKMLVPKQNRITLKAAIQHPWLKDIQKLKQKCGSNKKNLYV